MNWKVYLWAISTIIWLIFAPETDVKMAIDPFTIGFALLSGLAGGARGADEQRRQADQLQQRADSIRASPLRRDGRGTLVDVQQAKSDPISGLLQGGVSGALLGRSLGKSFGGGTPDLFQEAVNERQAGLASNLASVSSNNPNAGFRLGSLIAQ